MFTKLFEIRLSESDHWKKDLTGYVPQIFLYYYLRKPSSGLACVESKNCVDSHIKNSEHQVNRTYEFVLYLF